MNRKIYFWKLPSTELAMGERTLIMGVLNVTPDSFSDGGVFTDPDRAHARALQLEEQGADIIDLGAESTRPDSKRISADEEWRRLLPVLKLLKDKLTIPLSLDTYKSEIAERALQYGVSIFNDPSGLTFDANLAKVAAEHNAGLILNHMRGTPETWGKLPALPDVVGAVSKDMEATISRARRSGVEKNRIVVDPGLGFGKRREQNSEILAHLARLAELDYPILVGPSRKSFLGHAALEGETAFATAAAVTIAILHGAHIVRVHDVAEMKIAANVADEVLRAGAAHEKAVQEASERAAAKPRPRPENAFGVEEKVRPTRPPLLRRDPPPTPIEIPKPAEKFGEKPGEDKSIEEKSAREERRPERSAERPPFRPVFRKPAADRPAKRRDSEGRPPRPFGDRPSGDRPNGDRPPRPGGDRPPRSGGDRPTRPFGDRPRGDRPPRPGGDRPGGFRPGGDRPRDDRPPRSGPPRSGPPKGGASRDGRPSRPPGDRPPRPFRKRP